jgi:hypothetical protein
MGDHMLLESEMVGVTGWCVQACTWPAWFERWVLRLSQPIALSVVYMSCVVRCAARDFPPDKMLLACNPSLLSLQACLAHCR